MAWAELMHGKGTEAAPFLGAGLVFGASSSVLSFTFDSPDDLLTPPIEQLLPEGQTLGSIHV
ncbi:hypothetical protein A6R68_08214 [Neotoma lepida]|uniref:Uncharacterized protein n=1 Tax=Neotoma lepida TaxID=56216 RepID=A0A1A6G5Q2_NEOLE|nr:hypothetical protein A6R68_08214 [Neotoma lepida]